MFKVIVFFVLKTKFSGKIVQSNDTNESGMFSDQTS